MKKNILIITVAMLLICCFTQCKKDEDEALLHNIILYNQPLKTIQRYVQGKWKLEFMSGGLIANQRSYPKDNSYMQITSNNIVFGNDTQGIIASTSIVWKQDKDIFGDSTYLLTYSYSNGYVFPFMYVVDRINNDTLILVDNAYDPMAYGYTKLK